MRAIAVTEFGGPEVLRCTERPMPLPDVGKVLIAQQAIGVNFVDLNHRSGTPYPITAPFVPGIEAVGQVIAVGEGVAPSWSNAYVGYAGPMPGAYASHAVVAASDLVRIPAVITPQRAAAILMQGMTAYYLSHRVTDCGAGDCVLVHAAASGVGRHLARWLKAKGANVIGTSRRPEGVDAMRTDGIDHPLLSGAAEDLPDMIAACLGRSQGVTTVFDSIGGPLCIPSLATLAPKASTSTMALLRG